MASKIVSDKQKSASAIDALIEANLDSVSDAAAKLFASHTAEIVELRPLLHGLRGFLASQAQRMGSASQAHDDELSDDPEALQKRDDATNALYAVLTRTRELFSGVFGVGALASLGFSGPTPQDPVLLSSFARSVVSSTQKNIAALKPIDDDLSFKPAKKLSEIEAAIALVESTLANVAKEKREADQTLAAKNQAIDSYDAAFSKVANALVALFALVGQQELAQKAKPSTRRPGQTEVETYDPA